MPSIPLAEAMIVWTANREPWTKEPWSSASAWAPPGSIAVVRWPDDRNAYTRYPSSAGACDRPWQEGDEAYRLQRLADLFLQFQLRDNMNLEHVAQAFREIEGIERIADYRGKLRHDVDHDELEDEER